MRALKASTENSSDVITLVNAAGRVLYASASSAKIFGYLSEELLGRNTLDLIHPEDRDHSRDALRAVLAKPPSPRQVELRVRRKDGEWCWVESTISNLLHEPGVGAIAVNYREIYARRVAREQEPQQTEELVRSNAQFEDFAYALAHDLREPLRTISMFTDVLVKESKLDANGKQLAQFIVDGVKRMSALIEGLNAFAIRGLEDSPQPVDLGHVVEEVLQSLGHAITTSGAIVTVDSLPLVHGNGNHLLRVLQNLIVNAIKYRSEAPVEIHVSAERLGPDWLIKVKDNGIGIAPVYHERVFGLLQRLHGPEIPGAGVGLAICKKIIEADQGAIWVESVPGSGSTFCFTIAAVKEARVGSANPCAPEFQVGNNVVFAECPSAGTPVKSLYLTKEVNWAEIEDRNLRSLLARLSQVDVPVIDERSIAPLPESERHTFWGLCADLGALREGENRNEYHNHACQGP